MNKSEWREKNSRRPIRKNIYITFDSHHRCLARTSVIFIVRFFQIEIVLLVKNNK